MKEVIDKLESLIEIHTKINMTEPQINYVAGLADALEIVKSSVSDNLIIGNTYFVIMYRNGDCYLPYVEKMKLYKISEGTVKSSYCFTRNLTKSRNYTSSPDLVLASKKGIVNRVFFTKEQAENSLLK